jgi:hypothetical protein
MFDVDLVQVHAGERRCPTRTAGTGFTLLEGPFVSDVAADFDFRSPCFVAG